MTRAIRRLVALGELSDDRAADARLDLSALPLTRYPHQPLLPRAWELRRNLNVYVALADILAAPLLTCDARIASAPGHTTPRSSSSHLPAELGQALTLARRRCKVSP